MSDQHQQINEELERQYEAIRGSILVAPSALAVRVFEHFRSQKEIDPHIQYTSLEHLKAMARRFLAKKHNPDNESTEAYSEQGDFSFSGKLQLRYPTPHAKGEEPQYKLREHLTPEERKWNVDQLRKSGRSRLEHADALEAEGLQAAA